MTIHTNLAQQIADEAGAPQNVGMILSQLVRPRLSREEIINRRLNEIALASAALFGLVRPGFTGPVPHVHQDIVMGHLDDLFHFTPAESNQARDMLFEATLNHSIHETDRPRIMACANELTRIAANYRGSEAEDRAIWAAGYDLFEVESLWDAANPVGGHQ